MSEYLEVKINFSGDGFMPEILKDKFPYEFTILSVTGQKKKKGRYKDTECPHGSCYFKITTEVEHDLKIKTAVEVLNKVKKMNKKENLLIEDFGIHLYYSGCQGNMELTIAEIKELAKLDNTVCMNYIYEDDDEQLYKGFNCFNCKKDNFDQEIGGANDYAYRT